MNVAEINRKLNNLISIGTVTESKSSEGLSLARVKILERVTDFFPVVGTSNSFKTHATPIKVGEQVLVFCPYGEADSGIILGSIFNKGQKEPVGANDTTEVVEYSDGTRLSYDTSTKELKIDASDKITILAQAINVTATSVNIDAEDITLSSASVLIDGPLHVTEEISTDATIADIRGDLTNFSTTDGAARA